MPKTILLIIHRNKAARHSSTLFLRTIDNTSVFFSDCLSVRLSVCLFVLSILQCNTNVHVCIVGITLQLFVCLFDCLSVTPSVLSHFPVRPICMSVHPSVCLPATLPTYLSVCLFVSMSVSPFCLSVRLFV